MAKSKQADHDKKITEIAELRAKDPNNVVRATVSGFMHPIPIGLKYRIPDITVHGKDGKLREIIVVQSDISKPNEKLLKTFQRSAHYQEGKFTIIKV